MKQYLLKILYANLMKLNVLTSFIMVDRHFKKNSFWFFLNIFLKKVHTKNSRKGGDYETSSYKTQVLHL